ncbi:MAG TPA: alpha/beta hydrolase [Longimicrobiales bacterium]|nr:alpha/beta hydrolase [Longimicrobiales bacterium]
MKSGPLHYETVTAGAAPPGGYLYVLHGIFGAGRNWASVSRRLVQARPEWGVRLIDLRQHGASQGLPRPHTVAAAARDLEELADQLGEAPAGVLGHSFGGKVALMYAREHGADLRQLWVIDSTPEARTPAGSAWQMLELIQSAPPTYASREELIALISGHGFALPVAQWMATNLRRADAHYEWRFDLAAIEELLTDFFRVDLWDVIESEDRPAELHIVKARESSVLSPDAVTRIRAAAERNTRVHYHEIAGGHWVNAENPAGLHELLVEHL